MKRKLLIALLAFAALLIAARPLLEAERYRARIHQALESSLRRRVEILGKVTFGIWNGPGFSITDVVIHEDPAVGMEPFAYVAALDANVSVFGMLQGRWEVESVLLDEPRLNLVKQDSGNWNIRPFLHPPATPAAQRFPELKVRGGRINLKFGDTKSALYLTAADIDVTSESDSSVKVRFSADPARTDRLAQGFGTLEGFGRYRWHNGKPSELEADIELNRSAISEIVTLLGGPGTGIRGFLASKARIQGPVNDLKIEGSLRLEELQRAGLLRSAGAWPIKYKGSFQLATADLDIATLSDQPADPRFRLRAHSLFEQPTWGVLAQFQDYPVASIRDLFLTLNLPAPAQAALEGKFSGVLGYSRHYGMQGLLESPETVVKTTGQSFRLLDARFIVDGGLFRLAPARLDLGEGRTAEFEGSYAPAQLSFSWRTGAQALPVKDFLAAQKQLLGVTDTPLLDSLEAGSWQGALNYRKTAEITSWDGAFQLRKAALPIEGLASPVELETARGTVQANRVLLDAVRGKCGAVTFTGSYRMPAAASRPHLLDLQFAKTDIAALEKLLLPTLRRGSNLLARLSLGKPSPRDWLAERHLEAALRIEELFAGETWLGGLTGKLLWHGAQAEIREARWNRADASAEGRLVLNLTQSEPAYTIAAEFENIEWKGGTIGGAASLETTGTGGLVIRNTRARGAFQASALTFSPDAALDAVSGSYELTIAKGAPQVKLSQLEATAQGEALTGSGSTDSEGRLVVDLAGPRKKVRIGGPLWPLQLEAR